MNSSVRLRLTLAVLVTTGLFVGLAVFFGIRQARAALLEDAIEQQTSGLDPLLFLDPELEGLEPQFFEFEQEDAISSIAQLEGTESLGKLLTELGLSADDAIPVLLLDGSTILIDNGAAARVAADGDPIETLVPSYVLSELAFVNNELDQLGLMTPEYEFVVAPVGDRNLLALVDTSQTDSTVNAIETTLWVATAALALFASLITWLLTGRALKPVAEIANQASRITSGNLHERVPVPQTGDEIAALAGTVNGMLDRIEAGDRRRRQFVSDASHELRTPVAILKSEAEVALRLTDETSVEELADSVLAESTRMAGLVEDLLSLARRDEGRDNGTLAELDLDDIVLEEAARPRPLPVDKSAVSAARVFGRSADLCRAVGHLLDNAVRHARSQTWIGLRDDGDKVILWVDDDGQGVPADQRDSVFQRFTRLEEARTRDKGGAGLGLAVVKATVESLDGTASVEESPTGGARFLIVLPKRPS